MKEKKQCEEQIYDNIVWHPHQCTNNAKAERDGKWYCSIHDPVKIMERQKTRDKKQDEKMAAFRKQYRLTAAAPDLYEATGGLLSIVYEMQELDFIPPWNDEEARIITHAAAAIKKADGDE